MSTSSTVGVATISGRSPMMSAVDRMRRRRHTNTDEFDVENQENTASKSWYIFKSHIKYRDTLIAP